MMHLRTCTQCGQPFEQAGVRGRLRQTCSAVCTGRREEHRRGELRRQRYAHLRDLGACTAVARLGSEGPHSFRGAVAAVTGGDL